MRSSKGQPGYKLRGQVRRVSAKQLRPLYGAVKERTDLLTQRIAHMKQLGQEDQEGGDQGGGDQGGGGVVDEAAVGAAHQNHLCVGRNGQCRKDLRFLGGGKNLGPNLYAVAWRCLQCGPTRTDHSATSLYGLPKLPAGGRGGDLGAGFGEDGTGGAHVHDRPQARAEPLARVHRQEEQAHVEWEGVLAYGR